MIVPVLDEDAHLPALCASLDPPGAAPADRPDELLVVDGGSRDGTPELARRAGAVVLEAPRGRGAQLAHGARHATADVLVFLHADVRLAPGSLACVRRAFADPGLAAAGMLQVIDHPRRVYRTIERAANRRVARGWIYGDSGLCVRRDVYERAGGFRPDLPLFEDLDLSRRLRGHGRIELLEGARLVVSPRRWERTGPVRQTLLNRALTVLWLAGVHPRRLARFYPPRPSPAGTPATRA